MKRYHDAVAIQFFIESEHPEVATSFRRNADLREAVREAAYRTAREQGILVGDQECPPGARCHIAEAAGHLVVRLIVPPRLV